ncbi:conserved membrane hypothetical protein [Gammaproteobacteria bacterium]
MEGMKSFAGFVMRSPSTAATVVAVTATVALILPPATSPISFLSGASLGLVTLRLGARAGLSVMGVATVVLALLALALIGTASLAVAMVGVLWAPIWFLSLVLRATVSLPRAVTVALGMVALGLGMTHWLIGDLASWWRMFLMDTFVRVGPEPGPELAHLIDGISQVMTGLVAAGMLISLVGNLLLARWWQSLLYNPGGFAKEFLVLRLHPAVGLVALGAMALTQFGPASLEPLGVDLVFLMMAAFFIAGLAVVHGLNANFGEPVGWLVGVYMLTFLFPRQMMTVLAATGLADTWVDLRSRIGRST